MAQERYQPAQTEVVLPTSVHARGNGPGSLRAKDLAWRAQPNDLGAAAAYARAAFMLGLSEGDLRWFGTAKAAMLPWWTRSDLTADGFFIRGLVQQGFHGFDAGLADINLAIAKDPQRSEFWSWRFALHLLQADLAAAQNDQAQIAQRFGAQEGDVYRAILLYRTGQPQAAAALLKSTIAKPDFQDPSSQVWLGFHWGEALRLAGASGQAIAVYEQLLKAQPQSHLIRLALAELLNQQRLYKRAKTVATVAGSTDALLMQALLASRGLQAKDEADLASQMQARLAAQALRQESLIERPKLIYLIAYGHDPAAGLALSIDNWKLQKEAPDALLFVQAALAVQQPQAAKPVVQWVEKTGYVDPQLSPLLSELKTHPRWSKP